MIFGKATGTVEPEQQQDLELTTESVSQIMEAAILESTSTEELLAFLENQSEVQEAEQNEILVEKSIVRLDRQARLNHAQKMAIFQIAGEKNDPLYKKLVTVWRVERNLEDKLFRKYGSEGMRRARAAASKAGTIKSGVVKRAAANVQRQFNSVKV